MSFGHGGSRPCCLRDPACGHWIEASISLYTFAETVSSANKDVKHIAKDVSLTSAVLKELGENLKNDKQNGIASDDAIKTADEVVHECSEVFREINTALETGSGKGNRKLLGSFKWPLLQLTTELLRRNLERLKSTLILMLHILTYAIEGNSGFHLSQHSYIANQVGIPLTPLRQTSKNSRFKV